MMKKSSLVYIVLLFSAALFAQKIPYTTCMDCWNADSLGNYRVVAELKGTGNVGQKPPFHGEGEIII